MSTARCKARGGTAAAITGSAGVNTVTVAGTAVANGDLGDGNDVLDVAGTLDTGGGVFALGDGDDDFVVHDGTVVIGTVDGGAGLDTRVYDINRQRRPRRAGELRGRDQDAAPACSTSPARARPTCKASKWKAAR